METKIERRKSTLLIFSSIFKAFMTYLNKLSCKLRYTDELYYKRGQYYKTQRI